MKMLHKEENIQYEIFDIAYDSNGYPLFLIYKDGQWIRVSAKYFTPRYVNLGYGKYGVME